eukprot:TRINITY_DN2467_c0_g3_i1.p1 TRINITY_DN2467_c0_g3~~TRINITY_DN2467_c0_g3_i1.p1  ORF type:complete len:642 (+),score=190.38 TRINITY_DN2467_c0_g3_i1:76-1926(+)
MGGGDPPEGAAPPLASPARDLAGGDSPQAAPRRGSVRRRSHASSPPPGSNGVSPARSRQSRKALFEVGKRRRERDAELADFRIRRQDALRARDYAQAELLAIRISELQRAPLSPRPPPAPPLGDAGGSSAAPEEALTPHPPPDPPPQRQQVKQAGSAPPSPTVDAAEQAQRLREANAALQAAVDTLSRELEQLRQAGGPAPAPAAAGEPPPGAAEGASAAPEGADSGGLSAADMRRRDSAAELALPVTPPPPTPGTLLEMQREGKRLAAAARHRRQLQQANRRLRKRVAEDAQGGVAEGRAEVRRLDADIAHLQKELVHRTAKQRLLERRLKAAAGLLQGGAQAALATAEHQCAAEVDLLRQSLTAERARGEQSRAAEARTAEVLEALEKLAAERQVPVPPTPSAEGTPHAASGCHSPGGARRSAAELEQAVAEQDRRIARFSALLAELPERRKRRRLQLARGNEELRSLLPAMEDQLRGLQAALEQKELALQRARAAVARVKQRGVAGARRQLPPVAGGGDGAPQRSDGGPAQPPSAAPAGSIANGAAKGRGKKRNPSRPPGGPARGGGEAGRAPEDPQWDATTRAADVPLPASASGSLSSPTRVTAGPAAVAEA